MDLPDIGPQAKSDLRRRLQALLRGLSPQERATGSAALRRHLEAWPEFGAAGCLAAFSPLPSEPDLVPLLAARLERIVFPRTSPAGLHFHRVPDLRWRRQGPGLQEPDPALHPEVPPEEIDLILVPGLAFSADGRRLGRGGGYYDRFLPRLRAGVPRVGVAFRCQILEMIPCQPHDARVSHLLTPEGLQPVG